jgi:hypothetical protein
MDSTTNSNAYHSKDVKRLILFIGISIFLPFVYLFYTANVFPSLADEGYLWSNAQFVLDGLVPIRDFNSYDPFRYYFCVPFLQIFGRGILSVRIAMATVQVLSLFCLLCFLNRHMAPQRLGTFSSLLVATSMLLWYSPYHKSFDISMPIYLIALLAWFMQKTQDKKFFVCGLCTGLSFLVGRNHALYFLLSFIFGYGLLLVAGERNRVFRRVLLAGAGIIVGAAPMLLMFAFIPGYLQAYFNAVIGTFAQGNFNLKLPITWLWKVNWAQPVGNGLFLQIVLGIFFTLVPLFMAGTAVLILWRQEWDVRDSAGIMSCIVVGLVYLHYAFSRADIGHVAHSIAPVIAAIMLLSVSTRDSRAKITSIVSAALILCYTALGIGPQTKAYAKHKGNYTHKVTTNDGAVMIADENSYQLVSAVKEIIEQMGGANRQILFAPYIPGMYAVVGYESPAIGTYFLNSVDMDQQQKMIEDLESNNTSLIVLGNMYIDNREELSFQRLYPMIYFYLEQNYIKVPSGLPDPYFLFIKK